MNIIIAFLFFGLVVGALWQAFLCRVWGTKILKEQFTGRVLYLKTKEGEFRFDKVHKKFSYKLKGDTTWWSKDYSDGRSIEIVQTTDTASLFEFFLGGWNILDLAGRYRDLVHKYTIYLKFADGDALPVITLKQYEQRDWFLSQLYLDMYKAILRKFGMYREADIVAEQIAFELRGKLEKADFKNIQSVRCDFF